MNTGKSGIEQIRNNYFRSVDYWLVIPILILTTIGLFVLNRVLADGFDDYPQNLYRQAGAAVLGLCIALFVCLIDTHFLKLIGWVTYIVSVILLVFVLIDSYSEKIMWGADTRLSLPVIGTFQPSELSKIGLVIVTAYIFEAMREKDISYPRGFLYILIVYAIPLELIRRQPDFGTAMVIVFSFMCMLFVWGVKYRYLFLGVSVAVVGIAPIMWNLFGQVQKTRILSFIFEGSDPEAEYNLIRSKAAIASGGLIGNQTGETVTVPIKWSDFIYSAVSEHMGFIGTTAVVILSFLFLLRCLYVASKATAKSYSYIVIGLSGALAFHFIENMGMCVGLLPITGIPLPFISLGGTALLVNFISFGIILNISMERNTVRK